MFTNKFFFVCFFLQISTPMQTLDIVGRKQNLCLELPKVILHLIHEYMNIDGVLHRTCKAPPNSLIGVIDDYVFYGRKGKVFMNEEDTGLEIDSLTGVYKVYNDWLAFVSILICYVWNRNTKETITLADGCRHLVHKDSIYYIMLPDSLYRYDIMTRNRIKVMQSVKRLTSIGDSLTLWRKGGSSLMGGPICGNWGIRLYEWENHVYKIHCNALEDTKRHVTHLLHHIVDDVRAFDSILLITCHSGMSYVWDIKHNQVHAWDFCPQLVMRTNDSSLCYQVGDTVFVLKYKFFFPG